VAYQTVEACGELRDKCLGRQAVPLRVLVPVLLTMFAIIVGSHLALTTSIADNTSGRASMATELRLRSERVQSIEDKCDKLLTGVAELKSRLERMERTNGEARTP